MMQIASFVEKTNNAKTIEDLCEAYCTVMGQFGYDRLLFALLTDHPSLNKVARHDVLSSYPEGWVGHYLQEKYDDIDPVRRQAFKQAGVYRWDDLKGAGNVTEKQIRMFHEAEDAKLFSGIGISMRGEGGAIAGIGAASSIKEASKDPLALDQINLLSYQFYTCYCRMSEKETIAWRPMLSKKESEILKWSAHGLSRSEVADKLAISQHTVDFHMRNLFKKLDTVNITHCVAKAINTGIIQI